MTTKPRSVFGAFSQRVASDTRGVTLVIVALAFTVLIGFAGLGVETGFWYAIKRQNQSAADVAALSGAFELLAGKSYSDICGFAQRDATRNGFTFQSFTCPMSTPACTTPSSGQMCANNPPVLGAYAGQSNAVEVILAQQQNALFASIPGISLANVTIDTRAVAVISILDQACVLALNATASNEIFIKGNPTLNMPNCSIVADSNSPSAIHLQGSASIIADTIITAGGVTTTGNPSFTLNKPAQTHAQTVADPYASTLTHTFLTSNMPASCATPTNIGGVLTYSANSKICGGLSIKNQIVNLSAPGTYWVTDGDLDLQANGVLECTACNPTTGVGITIIFTIATGTTVGTITGKSNSNIGNPPTAPNFNAPNSGIFKGLLLVQDSNGLPAGTTWDSGTFQGGPSAVLNGLVYAPKGDLTFNGNPAAGGTGCLILVVNTLTLSGDSQLNSTGCSAAGVSPPTPKTVALAE